MKSVWTLTELPAACGFESDGVLKRECDSQPLVALRSASLSHAESEPRSSPEP